MKKSSSNRAAFFLLSVMIGYGTQSYCACKLFSVTSFGAVPGETTHSTEAFLAAWRAACNFEGESKVVIPQGTFLLKSIEFSGPCYGNSSPGVVIEGMLKAPSDWHDFSNESWIRFQDLNRLNIGGKGTLHGQGALFWSLNTCHKKRSCRMLPTMLSFSKVTNSIVSQLSLLDSQAFHIKFHECSHIRADSLKITSPDDSPNTDGIHLGESDHVSITNSIIGTGDDCISIGPGSTNVLVLNVTCGPGHGISVGSLGKYKDEKDVNGLLVKNCKIMNTDNGVRIKTWPGSAATRATNFTFEDILMVNVANPIIIDQEYCPLHDCNSDQPSQVEVSNITFKRIRGTSQTEVAVNLLCSKEVPCENVRLSDIDLSCPGRKCTSSCSNVEGSFSGMQIPNPCLQRHQSRQSD